MQIQPIGTVRRLSEQEFLLDIDPAHVAGLSGIEPGHQLDVLYWMHRLTDRERATLKVHPRGDQSRPLRGVFGLRSPLRPNPIGVSSVRVRRIEHSRLFVSPFDAADESPILDLKVTRKPPDLDWLIGVWGQMHEATVATLTDTVGEDRAAANLHPRLRALGERHATEPCADATAIGRVLMRWEEHWHIQGRVVEESADRFVREVTDCPWSRQLSPASCRAFAAWAEGACGGMNSEFAYHLEQMQSEGAKTCIWSVTKNPGNGQPH
jgi:L-fuculose-phosphate aldolase